MMRTYADFVALASKSPKVKTTFTLSISDREDAVKLSIVGAPEANPKSVYVTTLASPKCTMSGPEIVVDGVPLKTVGPLSPAGAAIELAERMGYDAPLQPPPPADAAKPVSRLPVANGSK